MGGAVVGVIPMRMHHQASVVVAMAVAMAMVSAMVVIVIAIEVLAVVAIAVLSGWSYVRLLCVYFNQKYHQHHHHHQHHQHHQQQEVVIGRVTVRGGGTRAGTAVWAAVAPTLTTSPSVLLPVLLLMLVPVQTQWSYL
jgi:hypothetical protein